MTVGIALNAAAAVLKVVNAMSNHAKGPLLSGFAQKVELLRGFPSLAKEGKLPFLALFVQSPPQQGWPRHQ